MKINTKKISNVLSEFSKNKSSKSPNKFYTTIKLESTTITTKTIPRQITVIRDNPIIQENFSVNNSNTKIKVYINKNINKKHSQENISSKRSVQNTKIKPALSNPNLRINKKEINKNYTKRNSNPNLFIKKKTLDAFKKSPEVPKKANLKNLKNEYFNHTETNIKKLNHSSENLHIHKKNSNISPKLPRITSPHQTKKSNEIVIKKINPHQISGNKTANRGTKKMTITYNNSQISKELNNKMPRTVKKTKTQSKILVDKKKSKAIKNENENTVKKQNFPTKKEHRSKNSFNNLNSKNNNIYNIEYDSQRNTVKKTDTEPDINNNNETMIPTGKRKYEMNTFNVVKHLNIKTPITPKENKMKQKDFKKQLSNNDKEKNKKNLDNKKSNNNNFYNNNAKKTYNKNNIDNNKDIKNKNINIVNKNNKNSIKNKKEHNKNKTNNKNAIQNYNKNIIEKVNLTFGNNEIDDRFDKNFTLSNNYNEYDNDDKMNTDKYITYDKITDNSPISKNKVKNNTNNKKNNNKISIDIETKSKTAKLFFKGMKSPNSASISTIKNTNLNISSSKSNTINSIKSFKVNKIIIKYDELLTFEAKLKDIINCLSKKDNIYNMGASNECVEFISFYFQCSLNGILKSFFAENNRIIIHSWSNLLLFSVIITYHLSITPKMLEQLIDDLRYIFSLIIANFYLLIKRIQVYYGKELPKIINDKFKQNLIKYKINSFSEKDIIVKINKNCCNIAERLKIILNNYQRNKNQYYTQFNEIFSNISTITEKIMNNYFYKYVYKNPFYNSQNKEQIRTSKSTGKKRRENNLDNVQNISKKGYFSENEEDNKSDEERELLSVISEKSAYYHGKITSLKNKENKNENNTINEINENNIINNQNENPKVAKAINYYIENKIEAPFIKTPCTKKYTLVLDLDETLIHLQPKFDDKLYNQNIITNSGTKNKYSFYDNTNPIDVQNLNKNESHKYLLLFRVGLFSFLTILKPFYELISFTSASREYADPIIKEIEKNKKYFDYCFYREHCVVHGNNFVKDISRIGRDIKKMIIVDNNENNFSLNKENGIKICPYYGDNVCFKTYEMDIRTGNNRSNTKKCDNTLIDLKKILILIYKANYEDLRIALKDFRGEIFSKVTVDRINTNL